jgi:hypothetical protein
MLMGRGLLKEKTRRVKMVELKVEIRRLEPIQVVRCGFWRTPGVVGSGENPDPGAGQRMVRYDPAGVFSALSTRIRSKGRRDTAMNSG